MIWVFAVIGIVSMVYLFALGLTIGARKADEERAELLRRISGQPRASR